MTTRLPAVTRAVLMFATLVTGFIIRHSAKITAAATVIHAWALNATVDAAYKKSDKAYDTYRDMMTQFDAMGRLVDRCQADCVALRNVSVFTHTAAVAELEMLGRA